MGRSFMQILSDLKSSEIDDLDKKILSIKLIAILMKRHDIFHWKYFIFSSDLDRGATSQIKRKYYIMQTDMNDLWSIDIIFFKKNNEQMLWSAGRNLRISYIYEKWSYN